MSGSSLPVWMTVFLFGELFIMLFSFINPYVPKSQKAKAKDGEDHVIYYTTRVNELFILLIGFAIVIATTVIFAIEDYSNLAMAFRGGILGNIIAVALTIFGFFIAEVIIILTIIIVEEIVISDTKKYYERRYRVALIDVQDYDSSF